MTKALPKLYLATLFTLRYRFRLAVNHPSFPRARVCMQTTWFAQCQCYCVVEIGRREVGKTRALKLTPRLTWEQPEERFRLPIDELQPIPTTADEAMVGETMTTPTHGKEDCQQQPHEGVSGSRQLHHERVLDRKQPDNKHALNHQQQHHERVLDHQQQLHDERAVSPECELSISVWSKSIIGGSRELLGTATVPPHYIDHPPGDVRLTLQEKDDSRETFSTGPSHRFASSTNLSTRLADHDTERSGEKSDKKSSKRRPVSGTKQTKGGGSTWGGGGLLKTLRGGTNVKGRGKGKEHGRTAEGVGSVNIWLGKAVRSSASGQQPGHGLVTLRVHAASGIRKVWTAAVTSSTIPAGLDILRGIGIAFNVE